MTFSLSYAFPTTSQKWLDLVVFLVGALWGYLLRPWMWVLFPLPSWVACMVAVTSQESAFDRYAEGDGGASLGMAQFNDANALFIGDDASGAWRYDPFQSGYAAALYAASAAINPAFWLCLLPLCKYPLLRQHWTSDVRTGGVDLGAAFVQVFDTEERGLSAFTVWSLLLWGPTLLALYCLGRKR